jgi:hypothetical protein
MTTTICKYCFFIITTLAAKGLAAQSASDVSVAFKEIHKNGSTENFTIREIKKKELQIVPSKIVTLNQVPAIDRKNSSKKRKYN